MSKIKIENIREAAIEHKSNNMAYGRIYKIYNSINNKLYIGQTHSTLQKRMSEHISRAKNQKTINSPLYNAMRKYGIENFFIEEIELIPQNLLDEREIYWIKYYNSFYNGYNATLGGSGSSRTKSDEILALWNQGYYQKEIAQKTGHKSQTVKTILLANGITEKELKERSKEFSNSYKYKPVLRIDQKGNITEYASLTECVQKNDISIATLSRGLKNNIPKKGYFWRYKNE